jgi:thiamine biosynthesis lipoprotein
MAGPCEILLDIEDRSQAQWLGEVARDETRRIETKFSRYNSEGMVYRINSSAGQPVEVDEETAGLLNLAAEFHDLSGGRFDITSGLLRKIWSFDGSDRVPSRKQAKALLGQVGWAKVQWNPPSIILPAGMEIDLGGVGKEYAVDRVAAVLAERTRASFLVNFGGDLRAVGPRRDGRPWTVGIERPDQPEAPDRQLQLKQGALATSGDANRFLLKNGVRYPHILNPRTGWPVLKAPRSVTVLADTCTEAGFLATMAMLSGGDAEDFLAHQGGKYWVIR